MSNRPASLLPGRPRSGRTESFEAPRVLIVNAEDTFRTLATRVMRRAGFETMDAENGFEALVIASAERFDVLLTDLEMPLMKGEELARRLRVKSPGLRVLYLTDHNSRLFSDQELLRDDEAYLDKPCTAKSLTDAVSMLAARMPEPRVAVTASAHS